MWRYWELLTDKSLPEIAAMKQREPMEVKMELGARIVADFHPAQCLMVACRRARISQLGKCGRAANRYCDIEEAGLS